MFHKNNTSSADRFIPRRAFENFDLSYHQLTSQTDFSLEDQLLTSKYYNTNFVQEVFKKRIYERSLWKTIAPDRNKILNFSEPICRIKNEEKCFSTIVEQWPVKPRKKPLIGSPFLVLDMPDLDTNICHHVIDWGSKGYLATVHDKEVHFCKVNANMSRFQTNTGSRVQYCVCWNNSGTRLAMSLDRQGIGVWDLASNKIAYEKRCTCIVPCTVTTMIWSPDKFLVTGCSYGRLIIWTKELTFVKSFYKAHVGSIINMSFSCNGKYLVTTGVDGAVRIYIWKETKEYFEARYNSPIRGIAWHPWKESLLSLGIWEEVGTLTLWNLNTKCESKYESIIEGGSSIDCIAWSSLTGEIVVSYYLLDNRVNTLESCIVVLSNADRITDCMEWHRGRVPYLIWGAEGTQLVTAASDENLCIWNFLGTSIERQNVLKKIKTKKKKLTTNSIDNLNIFGTTIR